jgi:hypothetical protein
MRKYYSKLYTKKILKEDHGIYKLFLVNMILIPGKTQEFLSSIVYRYLVRGVLFFSLLKNILIGT